MVLFVVMFAISNVDQEKFAGPQRGPGHPASVRPEFVALPGAESPLSAARGRSSTRSGSTPCARSTPAEGRAGHDAGAAEIGSTGPRPTWPPAQAELDRLDELARQGRGGTGGRGPAGPGRLPDHHRRAGHRAVRRRGVLRQRQRRDPADGRAVVDTLAPVLSGSGNAISAEGHANHVPGGRRARSTRPTGSCRGPRAAAVARRLIEVDGLAAGRGRRRRLQRHPSPGPGVRPGALRAQPARRPARALRGAAPRSRRCCRPWRRPARDDPGATPDRTTPDRSTPDRTTPTTRPSPQQRAPEGELTWPPSPTAP